MNIKKTVLCAAITSTLPRGEGDGDSAFTKEQLDSAVAAAVAQNTDDLSAKFNATKNEILGDLKKQKETIKRFEGIDPDQVRTMMSAFENDQDLKDISEGKHQDVIERRIEKERTQFTTDLNSVTEKATNLEQENSSLVQKVSKLLIDNNVVSQFIKEKGVETAIPDVILRANQVFKVEGDDLIPRGADGKIIAGKDGPMTITEWVDGLKESAAHLFPGSIGANTPGGDGGAATALDAKIAAASSAGDSVEYRRLRRIQKAEKLKKV